MDNYLSVSQVNNYIKGIFDNEMLLKNICIYGEISSYSISNGIAYFNLKDQDNMLNCVLFGATKFAKPNLGDMVLVTGSVSYYAKGGRLSFNATSIAPYGRGLLYEKFLQLKADLEAKGYFDPSHKIAIPERVKRIGVVTSATGAVIQDIIDVTTRRNDGIDIVLYPVKVQGVGAEIEIAKGINFFSEYDKVDVVIVARGGGSLEDLQPFNTLEVAEATYNCIKPIVSAVGHETDFTIIDFVSDLRAPTPSAAAELVAWDKRGQLNQIKDYLNRVSHAVSHMVDVGQMQISKECYSMHVNVNKLIETKTSFVQSGFAQMVNNINVLVANTETKIGLLNNSIAKLNPANIASRGYAKVLSGSKVVSSINGVNAGDNLQIELLDGNIQTVVNKVTKRD